VGAILACLYSKCIVIDIVDICLYSKCDVLCDGRNFDLFW